MKTRFVLAIGAATAIGIAAVGAVSHAHGPDGSDFGGMGMMGGVGMQDGPGGMTGSMGMMGGHGRRMLEMMDADGDGKVSADEAKARLDEELKTYDANGDGALSIDEFEKMHTAHIRPHMVDRFQFLDDDGDGKVTEAEMTRPMQDMMHWMDMNGDGALDRNDMMEMMHIRHRSMGGDMRGMGPGRQMRDDDGGAGMMQMKPRQ